VTGKAVELGTRSAQVDQLLPRNRSTIAGPDTLSRSRRGATHLLYALIYSEARTRPENPKAAERSLPPASARG
jgi:hypothetical protein